MSEAEKNKLKETRHQLGIFTITELSEMFKVGRHKIDHYLNTGQLKYISPNGRTRFVRLKEYVEVLGLSFEELKKDSNLCKSLSHQTETLISKTQFGNKE